MRARMHAMLAASCVAAFATATPAVWAHRITLNDTGMTQCIDHQKNWSSDCTKSHQDAAYGRDVNDADPDDGVAGFSFRKVCRSGQMAGEGTCPVDPVLGGGPDDWGCVYDNISQLTWEAKTADGGMHDGNRAYTNKGRKARDEPSDAAWLIDATNAEGLCGATNWRLPDVLDLQSIVDYGRGTPDTPGGSFIDPVYFPNNWAGMNWTRTDHVFDSKRAWYVNFAGGRISVAQRFDDQSLSARLVHNATHSLSIGPAALAKNRFIPSDDGTEVTDTMTGLVWRRCAAGMVWDNNSQTCDGTATEYSWTDALDYARANREGGWRLPNVKELFSIADHKTQSPAIDQLAFPGTPPSQLVLSSTPVNHIGDVYVQIVSFGNGAGEQQEVARFSWQLRLVRRGRE
jgi:hypothetical protein